MTSTPMQLNNNFRLPAEEILIRIPRIYMRIETPVTIIIKAHTTLLRKMLVQKLGHYDTHYTHTIQALMLTTLKRHFGIMNLQKPNKCLNETPVVSQFNKNSIIVTTRQTSWYNFFVSPTVFHFQEQEYKFPERLNKKTKIKKSREMIISLSRTHVRGLLSSEAR